jgi:hypothetical protein
LVAISARRARRLQGGRKPHQIAREQARLANGEQVLDRSERFDQSSNLANRVGSLQRALREQEV